MGHRADPRASWDTACRHLFRHVTEARELRRNPIVAHFFVPNRSVCDGDAVDELRMAILTALKQHEIELVAQSRFEEARRRQAIVQRHVLGRDPAASVAADLHLSIAQFYRERRAVCEAIARAIRPRETERSSAAFVAMRRDVAELARGRLLTEACEPTRAIDVFSAVAHSASDPVRRVEALCEKAMAFVDLLDEQPAVAALRDARALFSHERESMAPRDAMLAEARLDFALAFFESTNGRHERAKQTMQRTLEAIGAAGGDARELAVDVLLFDAQQANLNGEFDTFRSRLAAAQAQAATIPNLSPDRRARLCVLSGMLGSDKASDAPFDGCSAMLAAACDVAQKAGLIRRAVDAAIALAYHYALGRGDFASALQQAMPAVETALATREPVLIGGACLNVAMLRRAHRDFRGSFTLLKLAERHGKLEASLKPFFEHELAAAYLGIGDHRRARQHAESAYRLAAGFGNKRIQASVLRVWALADQADCRIASARERIAEGLELVERYGSRHSAASAYRVSASITGNQRHARVAAALNPHVFSFAL